MTATTRITRPLLTVKRMIPPPRAGAVPRDRLERRLRTAATRLTLVLAPAGWGKTSLLTGWAADPAERDRIAWVSLDETDDEPSRFWSYVLTALHEAGAVSAAPLGAVETAGVPPVELALPILLNELAESPHRHILVLDDYHELRDSRIHESVEFLLAYLPPALRVVIAARTDPPLPLARLRARGDLTELRVADLRFALDEATALVAHVAGTEPSPPAAAAVWERTEGWAAGLQFAGLAWRVDPARSGHDDRHLLDYFAAEVLPGLAPEQRDLLVRTAALDRLSGPLCDVALQVTGSAAVLEQLSRADLFVAALDGHREWYRCHPLLRDALSRESPADPEVLVRAAGWFAEQGRIDDAARHLLRAGQAGEATALLLRHAEDHFFVRGDSVTYLMLGEQVTGLLAAPEMAFSLAVAATLCGRQDRVIHWLDVCEAGLTAETTLPGWRNARAAILSLRATFALSDAESARSVDMAREALALETADGHPNVHTALGSALTRHGRFEEGLAILADRWQRDRARWRLWELMRVAGSLAITLAECGRGRECDRILREVGPRADAFERDGQAATILGLASLRTAAGRRGFQEGDAEGAITLLRKGIAYGEFHPRPLVVVLALIYLADAELACGRRAEARAALTRARDIVDDEPVSDFAMARLAESERRLGRGAVRFAVRSGALPEELTDRELSILRALQGTASQREIGAALFLSINTVKAYTKSLYRKLGVSSRQDAVTTGKACGLL